MTSTLRPFEFASTVIDVGCGMIGMPPGANACTTAAGALPVARAGTAVTAAAVCGTGATPRAAATARVTVPVAFDVAPRAGAVAVPVADAAGTRTTADRTLFVGG